MVQRRLLYGMVGILLVAIIGLTALNSFNLAISNDLSEQLQKHIIPIATTRAENGFEDLEPLREILKNKKIVAMGEATHGTKEFFEMKHRMFEFLVKELDYRVFAIEASFGGGQVVNAYINGSGTLEEAIRALGFWTWATEEVSEMLQWMRQYNDNADIEDRIRFYGFDMQNISEGYSYMLEYLRKVDSPEATKELYINYSNLEAALDMSKGNIEPFIESLKKIEDLITGNKVLYIANSSEAEYELTYQQLKVINQWIDLQTYKNPLSGSGARDAYMADNVRWIVEYEGELGNRGVMLWAHNGHIQVDGRPKKMGQYLRDLYMDDYYAVALDFYEGSFRSRPAVAPYHMVGTMDFKLDKTSTRSLASLLKDTGVPISFLDFKKAMVDKRLEEFLNSKSKMNFIGSVYGGKLVKHVANLVPADNFNALIFVRSTTAAVGILYESPAIIDRDGDRLLAVYYQHYVKRAAIPLAIIAYLIYYFNRKRKLKAKAMTDKEIIDCLALEDYTEKKRRLTEINRYLLGLSVSSYALHLIVIINVIGILSYNYNNIASQTNLDVLGIVLNIPGAFIATFIFNLLPLKLLAWMTRDKKNRLWHILAASLLVAVFSLYSSNWIMAAVNLMVGLLLNYTYVIYKLREKSPYMMVSLIRLASNIVLILFIEFMA